MTGGYWLLWFDVAHRAFVPLALLVLAGCAPVPDYPGCAPDGQLLAEWPDGITRRVVDRNGVRVNCIFPVEVTR